MSADKSSSGLRDWNHGPRTIRNHDETDEPWAYGELATSNQASTDVDAFFGNDDGPPEPQPNFFPFTPHGLSAATILIRDGILENGQLSSGSASLANASVPGSFQQSFAVPTSGTYPPPQGPVFPVQEPVQNPDYWWSFFDFHTVDPHFQGYSNPGLLEDTQFSSLLNHPGGPQQDALPDVPEPGLNHGNLGSAGPFAPAVSMNPTIVNVDWGYNCFDEPVLPFNGISAPVLIAPKPIAGQSVAESSTSSQDSTLETSPITLKKALKRKRKPLNEEKQAKVKRLRKLGACFRCKIYKLTCNEELPCENCIKVRETQKVYRGPCIRLNIEEVHTFRAGDADNGSVRAILPKYEWPSDGQVKGVQLQWPFSAKITDTPILIINYQPFTPHKEVLAEEYVANGQVHKVTFPPMACRNTTAARKNVEQFLTACQHFLEDEIQDTLNDPILKLTWTEVTRYRASHETPLLDRALQVYAGAMMNSKYPTSIEANVFGVEEQEYTPHFIEKLPLPPQLTYQIQTMIAQVMTDTQAQCLKELRARVFSKDRLRHWYEVFLTIFVLLATVEWVYKVQIRYIQAKQGVSTRIQTNISYVTQYMLDEWEASALNLVGHFRCVMNGEVPFSQSWDDGAENPRRTGLDTETVAFIRELKRQIEERREEFRATCSMQGNARFERPLAAISELFLSAEETKSRSQ